MGLLSLILDRIIPITLVVAILATIIWVLNYKNKQLHSILQTEKTRFSLYKTGIKALQNSPFKNPEKNFDALNKYMRAFFKEYLQLDYSLTYLELEGIFKEKNRFDYAKLCKSMSDAKYTGGKSKEEETKRLAKEFYTILEGY